MGGSLLEGGKLSSDWHPLIESAAQVAPVV